MDLKPESDAAEEPPIPTAAPNIFVTGTDTEVGKTYVSCALVREWRRDGLGTVGLKPLSCGINRADALALHRASENAIDLELLNPVHLATPAAPYLAAILESRPIDTQALSQSVRRARSMYGSVVVEGIGGWFVPITREYFVSDLAAELGLPVVVVVANRLGALNHTFLTVRAIRARGLHCAGVILNEPQPPQEGDTLLTSGNRMILENLLDAPILGELGFGERSIRWRDPVSGLATMMAHGATRT